MALFQCAIVFHEKLTENQIYVSPTYATTTIPNYTPAVYCSATDALAGSALGVDE